MSDVWVERCYVCHKCDSSITIVSKKEAKRHPLCDCSSGKNILVSVRELEKVESK